MKISLSQIIAVPCPTCGAEAGKKCELALGQPKNLPHRDRRYEAELIAESVDQAEHGHHATL